jgi:enoyl-CoA hydratase
MAQLIIERDGAVLTVRLSNPPCNFLGTPVVTELEAVLAAAERDPAVRAVVLASAVPEVFIGHYDFEELLEGAERAGLALPPGPAAVALRVVSTLVRMPQVAGALERTPAAGLVALLRFHRIVRRMRHGGTVFVAAISGDALGGGCELALACDIRVAADGPYQIGQPEILTGLLPGGGGSQLLARSLGTAKTIELTLEGRLLSPGEALDAGIVHQVVPPEELAPVVNRTAARLGRRSPAAVRAIKRAVYDGGAGRLERGMAMERAGFLSLAGRETVKDAMRLYRDQVRELNGHPEEPGAATHATGTHGSAAQGSAAVRGGAALVRERLARWQAGTVADFRD